ncbi:MAG: HAD family hydrolase [Terriglobia bacterium]|jgi:phosphoglycolate phosphatase-like HAD superfamily hydrolase
MEPSPNEQLYAFKPRHSFLVGVDSDGCVFDTMEIKHKECFIPNIIKYWKLQAVSKYARAAAEFVSLYSKWRGVNRFPALTKTIELLRDWPEAMRSGAAIPDLTSLQAWIDSGAALCNPALEAEVSRTGDPILKQALEWSKAANRSIADRVKGVPPFPWFRACAERLAPRADIICVSVAAGEVLEREWQEHDIAKYAAVLAGQEMGSKKEHLRIAAGGKYAKDCVLMIGDAPGDLAAARANGALFFPITPGYEEQSWERFYREGVERFFNQTYTGSYEASLIEEFKKLLPEVPPWKRAVGR